VDDGVAQRLVELNRAFYREFAPEYAQSRRVLQPGIPRAVEALGFFDRLLDLGCGDGRVRRALDRTVRYLGLDLSPALMAQADAGPAEFREVDLTRRGWSSGLGRFGAVVSFSALHHIPGRSRRRAFLREMRGCVTAGGRAAISVWQFQHQERFRRKERPWSEIGLDPGAVERGDVLMDWRRGGEGLRYVHHYAESELMVDCVSAGFMVRQTWRSDGESDDLGLYVILDPS